MKIAIHIPNHLPFSIKNYIDNVVKHLKNEVNFYEFSSAKEVYLLKDKVDIFWFPACGRSAPPLKFIPFVKQKKVILTFHGAANFSLPLKLIYPSTISQIRGYMLKSLYYIRWKSYLQFVSAVICVSKYARDEIIKHFGPIKNNVFVIHHGVDFNIYNTKDSKFGKGKYLLHVSQWEPRKNLDRIIKAYKLIKEPKPKLILKVSGYTETVKIEGVKIINKSLSPDKLADLYKNASIFIFPSLYEAFGMPILEAMACGCPVITSNITGCAEVAGDAALLVNPYSTTEIAEAMEKLIRDDNLRTMLVKKSLQRVKNFSWEKSAKEHLRVFEEVFVLSNKVS